MGDTAAITPRTAVAALPRAMAMKEAKVAATPAPAGVLMPTAPVMLLTVMMLEAPFSAAPKAALVM